MKYPKILRSLSMALALVLITAALPLAHWLRKQNPTKSPIPKLRQSM